MTSLRNGPERMAQQHQRSATGAGAEASLDVTATPTTSEAAIVRVTVKTLIARM